MQDRTHCYRVAVTLDGQRTMRVVKRGRAWPRLRPEWRWATDAEARAYEESSNGD